MSTVTDLVCNFGDVFELDCQRWDTVQALSTLALHPGWVQYNPSKPHINRQGLSVTSLDGGYSGIPDLDSLREYNIKHNTNYQESSFTKITRIVEKIPEPLELITPLQKINALGRCHFIRLGSGGFFPPHRDNGVRTIPSPTFRLLVPLVDFAGDGQRVWLQEGKPLNLKAGLTYFVNTTKVHSLFSFTNDTVIYVMNVLSTPEAISYVAAKSKIL